MKLKDPTKILEDPAKIIEGSKEFVSKTGLVDENEDLVTDENEGL